MPESRHRRAPLIRHKSVGRQSEDAGMHHDRPYLAAPLDPAGLHDPLNVYWWADWTCLDCGAEGDIDELGPDGRCPVCDGDVDLL